MLALRWASIQYNSQFSYFTMRDSLSRLSTILKIGNRENILPFEDMLIHEPIEIQFSVTFACLEAIKVKKIKKKIEPQQGKHLYRVSVFVYTNRTKWRAQKTHISAFQGVITTVFSTPVSQTFLN